MCQFHQNQSFDRYDFASGLDQENEFEQLSQLLIEAAELGVDTDFAVGLNQDMSHEQLQAIRELTDAAIADAEIDAAQELNPCPCDFAWRPEGEGYRCEGGSHYCTREEIRQYMKKK